MEAEASSRRPLLFGVVSDGPKPEKDPSPVPSKAGSQTGPPPFSGGHLVQDRPGRRPGGLLVPARQQIIVTAQLHVPPGRPDHVPHQWVKPMDAPTQVSRSR